MNIPKSINEIRGRIMRFLTKNIGKVNGKRNLDSIKKTDIKRVLICRTNHRLGNLLLITPLIEEVMETFPESKIDLLVQGGVAPILFKNYENVDKIIQLPKKPFSNLLTYFKGCLSVKKRKYDLAINAVKDSSSGKLFTLISSSKHKVFGEDNEDIELKFKDHMHIAKYQIYTLRDYLSKLGFADTNKKVPLLNLKLDALEIAEGQKALKKIVNNEKNTISIFTYATDDKCYSESWWEIFYERLKTEYSNYNIIEILPVENISQIGFKAPTLYSKDIREMASIIANTEVFIGADSGVMHLASAAFTPTVGLFSRANQNSYQPFGNGSVAINTNTSTIDDWIKETNKILIN